MEHSFSSTLNLNCWPCPWADVSFLKKSWNAFCFVAKCTILLKNELSISKPSFDWRSVSTCAFPAEVMAAISPGPLPDISPISSLMVEMFWFPSASHLSMFSLDQTKAPASSPWWFISESHFHPTIHSPWLLLFSHCELLFFSLGVTDAVLWLLWMILTVCSQTSTPDSDHLFCWSDLTKLNLT